MGNISKSLLILTLIVALNSVLYMKYLRPYILGWGAEENEIEMAMGGDSYADVISATRAINIKGSRHEVWDALTRLGADRIGFFSYTMLEKLYGCEINNEYDNTQTENFETGQFIPVTTDVDEDGVEEGFEVIEIDRGYSFVLKGWGEFLIADRGEGHSRLIIRTHRPAPDGIIGRVWEASFDMGHYIMERRMMEGIKEYVENGRQTGTMDTSDKFWLLGLGLSALGIVIIVIAGSGIYKIVVPALSAAAWQFALLVCGVSALWPVVLLALVAFLLVKAIKSGE